MRFSRLLAVAGFLSCVLLASGCDRGAKTYPVSGTVAFKGEPVISGEIVLVPSEPSAAAPVAAAIKNGVFNLRAEAGLKRVEVRAIREVPGKRTVMGPVSEQYIPARYNAPTTLLREITPDGPNRIELDLQP